MTNFISFIIIVFTVLFSQIFAQQKEFPKEINNYIHITLSLSECSYEDEEERKILYSDLNNDGKDDIIFQMIIVCETSFGNTVCTNTYFAIFIYKNKSYEFTDEITYKGCNINVPGSFVSIRLKSVEGNIVLADVYHYGVNDAHCCPSIIREVKFTYINNKFTTLDEIKEDEFVYPIIGDKLDFGEFYTVVDNVQFLKSIGNNYLTINADGIYLLIDLTVTNHENYPITINSELFEIRDLDYNTFRVAQNILPYLNLMERKVLIYEEISPKVPKKISFIYEVPYKSLYYLKISSAEMPSPDVIALVKSKDEFYKYVDK